MGCFGGRSPSRLALVAAWLLLLCCVGLASPPSGFESLLDAAAGWAPAPRRALLGVDATSAAAVDMTTNCGYTCPAGSYLSACNTTQQCESCPAGYYCPGACEAPVACAAGTALPEYGGSHASNCSACAAGYYSLDAGRASCAKCPAGYSCAAADAAPQTCSPGSYALGANTACVACPAGHFCSSTGNAPALCSNGSYSLSNWAYCVACPAGHFCPNTAAIPSNAEACAQQSGAITIWAIGHNYAGHSNYIGHDCIGP